MDRRLVKERKNEGKNSLSGIPETKEKVKGEWNHEKTSERATSARHCVIHAGFVLGYGTVSCQLQDGVEADWSVVDCRCFYWSPEKTALPLCPSISEPTPPPPNPFTVMDWLLALWASQYARREQVQEEPLFPLWVLLWWKASRALCRVLSLWGLSRAFQKDMRSNTLKFHCPSMRGLGDVFISKETVAFQN